MITLPGRSFLGAILPLSLTCKFSTQKSSDGLMGFPLYANVHVSFPSMLLRGSLNLYLISFILIITFHDGSLWFILFRTLCVSWILRHVFFQRSGKLSNFLLFLQISFLPPLILFSFWEAYNVNVRMLDVVSEVPLKSPLKVL